MNNALEARVRGVNRAHEYANQLYPKLRAIFESHVGTDILTKNGELRHNLKVSVDQLNLPVTPDLHVFRHQSHYSLAYTVKTAESTPNDVYYYSVTVYVGELNQGALTKLVEESDFRTDYTAVEVTKARQQYQEAKHLADKAQSNLYPFGEYDT